MYLLENKKNNLQSSRKWIQVHFVCDGRWMKATMLYQIPNMILFLPCPFYFRSVLESQNTNLVFRDSDSQYHSSSTNGQAVLQYNSPTKNQNDFRVSDGYVSL